MSFVREVSKSTAPLMAGRRFLLLPAALLVLALAPAVARAETRTFLKIGALDPTGGANTFGPATEYPSSIVVSGVAGTVTKVTVTVLDLDSSSPDDTDMVIAGPNGQNVMLMSDACGENPSTLKEDDWTFDDAAPTFLSNNGPCTSFQQASFKPTNYFEEEKPDDLSPNGGPPPPYLNALSFLAGGTPNGAWNLFVRDDNVNFAGFDINAWALTLEVEPPPPVTLPSPAPAPTPEAKATGKRAAAMARCKTRKTKKARSKCRTKARKLPV